MVDPAPPTHAQPALAPRRSRLRRKYLVIAICSGAVVFTASDYLAAIFLARDPYTLNLRLPVSLVALVVLVGLLIIGGAIVHFVRQWRRPLERVRVTLEQSLADELPVDEIERLDFGALSPLCPVLHDLLRDRRRQRATIEGFEREVGQRVAQRTDALERVVGRLRTQATRDALSGLYNRRMLDECLDELLDRCRQDNTPLGIAMVDIDDFKLLNDTLGHPAGDSLLKAVGQLIRSSIRPQDLAFRFGGDEFVIVLPNSNRVQSEVLLRRLTELVDALVKPLTVARRPRLSFGIAELAELTDGATGVALVAEADRRLYAAKFARKSKPRAA